MSLAIDRTELRNSPTWQQFQEAVGGTLVALALGCALYGIETLLLQCSHRFVENPADTMMRAVGLAHFIIGWFYMFTSRRLHHAAAIGRLSVWTGLGAGLCVLFSLAGDKNPLAQLAFLSFFFVHEICDEATLFRQSGELRVAHPERFLVVLTVSVSVVIVTMLAGFYIVRGHWLGRVGIMRDLPTVGLLVGWAALAGGATLATAHTMRRACAEYGSLQATIELYRPLFMIYACLGLLLMIGSCFGSIGVSVVILLHVMTWLVQTCRRLRQRSTPIVGLGGWLRYSPTGFVVLHVGMMAAFLVLFALRTHVWQRSGIICQLLAASWFPYWSIMHIAMAFGRPR